MKINTKVHAFIDEGVDPQESVDLDRENYQKANRDNCGIVRMMSWKPTGIAVGTRQSLKNIDLDKAKEDGVSVVRRQSAGTAILLTDQDIGMFVAFGKNCFDKVYKGKEVQSIFNNILLDALNTLGVQVDRATEKTHEYERQPTCFGGLAPGELIDAQARKIFGVDRSGTTERGYLQEGVIPLTDSQSLLRKYLTRDIPTVVEATQLEGHTFDEVTSAIVDSMYRMHPEWRV